MARTRRRERGRIPGSPADLLPDRRPAHRLAPGASDPEDLVRASFGFPLDREGKESILPEFDLTVIGRYFPDFEREITRRQG